MSNTAQAVRERAAFPHPQMKVRALTLLAMVGGIAAMLAVALSF